MSEPVPDAARPGWLRRCYDWVLQWAERPGGPAMLFALAFAEAVFFPVPPDVLLIALAFGAPTRAWRFAAICTAGSVFGGICGYALGALAAPLGKSLLVSLAGLDAYYHVADVYSRNAFAALVVAGFTPVPYKVFAVSAGIFHEWVGFGELVAASTISRAARFFLVAACIRRFGPTFRPLLERHLGKATLLMGLAVVGGFLVLAGSVGKEVGDVRLRGLVAELGGSNPELRREAWQLLSTTESLPLEEVEAIDPARPMDQQAEAYATLRATVRARTGPPPPGLDERGFRWLNGAGPGGLLDAIARAIHQGWILMLVAGLGALALAWRIPRTRGALGQAALAALLAGLLGSALKPVVARPRPGQALTAAYVVDGEATSSSMPSRHAALAGAAATPLVALHPAIGVGAVAGAAVVGWSRVYGGMHYPGDVLAGWVLGVFCALAVGWALRRRGWLPPPAPDRAESSPAPDPPI